MFCQKCGKENPDTAKFCNACAAPLTLMPMQQPEPELIPKPALEPIKCRCCGTMIQPWEKYCSKCLVIPSTDTGSQSQQKDATGSFFKTTENRNIVIISIIFLFLIFVVCIILSSGSSGPENVKDVIKASGGEYSTRTNFLSGTKTYTVDMTFTNTGSEPHTFFGGISIFNSDYTTSNYKGETMTLPPGDSKTITETFTTDYSFNFGGLSYKVE